MGPPAAATEGKEAVWSLYRDCGFAFIPRGLKHQNTASQKQHRSLAAGQPLPRGCAWQGAGTRVAQGAAACSVTPEPLGQDWPWHFLTEKPRGGVGKVSVSRRQNAMPTWSPSQPLAPLP